MKKSIAYWKVGADRLKNYSSYINILLLLHIWLTTAAPPYWPVIVAGGIVVFVVIAVIDMKHIYPAEINWRDRNSEVLKELSKEIAELRKKIEHG